MIKKLLCKIFGHKWELCEIRLSCIMNEDIEKPVLDTLVCARCGELKVKKSPWLMDSQGNIF